MTQTLTGEKLPYKALSDLAAARFAVLGAVDSEGLLTCDIPAADTDKPVGVPDEDYEEGDTACLAATPGSIVEVEVAAAVLGGARLMLDVTAAAEGRVITATTGKQVVALALEAQPTIGKRVRARLESPFFLP